MQVETFMREFGRLSRWFNKSEKQADPNQWYGRVQEIPDEAFTTIIDGFIDTHKFMPTPQEVRNAYQDWLTARPEKRSVRHLTHCDDCDSAGVLRVQIEEKDGTRDTLFRCGRCENWEGSLGTWIPQRRRADLESGRGYTVLTMRAGPEDDDSTDVTRARVVEATFPARGRAHVRDTIPEIREQDIPF